MRASRCRGPRGAAHLPAGIDALPVVQVEEHRRALGDGAEQVAEAPEDVRPDGVSLVLGEVAADRAFAGEDVEVVEPEVDEDFLELARGVDGTQHLLLAELVEDDASLLTQLAHAGALGRIPVVAAGDRSGHGRGGRVLAVVPALAQQRRVIALGDGRRIEGQRLEWCESRPHGGVRQPLGVELLIDVPLQSERPHMGDIFGTAAEAHTIEDVDDRQVVECRGSGLRDGAGRRQQQHAGHHGRGAGTERRCNDGHVSSTSLVRRGVGPSSATRG